MTSHTPGAAVGSARDGQPVPWPQLTKRLRPGDWLAIDCVVAVLLAVVAVVGSTRPAYHVPVSVAYTLALVSTLPVAVRRPWPLPVLGVVLAGTVAAMAIGTGKEPSVAVALVLYLVGLRYPRRTSAAVLAGVLAATAASTVAGGAALGYSEAGNVAARVAGEAVFLAASWAIGVAVREQRAYAAGVRVQLEIRGIQRPEIGRAHV